ncbi:MAG: hypothetical protein AAGD07_22840 [Planctomycetota bacterium]
MPDFDPPFAARGKVNWVAISEKFQTLAAVRAKKRSGFSNPRATARLKAGRVD